MDKALIAMLLLALIVISIIVTPLGTIWALNVISEESSFGWKIPHTIWTYVPIWVLILLWKSNISRFK